MVKQIVDGKKYQTLLGVTGSGKTFVAANIINRIQRPTLVIAHNKTLAAQLADEFRQFFPNNAIHYFVSYYDYYQPEAYLPNSDTYIEKDSSINDEIDRLRHAATSSLLTRNDVIIVASVSCIYGLGSPEFYQQNALIISVDDEYHLSTLIKKLISMQYHRNDYELKRGSFRVKGDILELIPAYENFSYRFELFGRTVEKISQIDPVSGKIINRHHSINLFPAKHFLTANETNNQILGEIKNDLDLRLKELEKSDKLVEAYRLKQRTEYDLEMLREIGYINGVENYSRYFDRRCAGQPPHTLLDYFPKNFLTIVDESHMTIPQIRGMYAGDRSRKTTLINYGFRLPSALDNRPLQFDEFEQKIGQTIFMSATPSEYEMQKSRSNPNDADDNTGTVELLVRPTGLVDPTVEIRPTQKQIDDLISEIQNRVTKNERTLVTTLTKKMAEALTSYFIDKNIKVQYLHSDVETVERTEIIADFRRGKFDVLIGINLLREGLDLPEVSLVAILDADKEGFLRSEVSLIQTIGRAARHINGKVILYADKVTDSMKRAISESDRRRRVQTEYNKVHHISPKSVIRSISQIERTKVDDISEKIKVDGKASIKYQIDELKEMMTDASTNLRFEEAALLRDKIIELEKDTI